MARIINRIITFFIAFSMLSLGIAVFPATVQAQLAPLSPPTMRVPADTSDIVIVPDTKLAEVIGGLVHKSTDNITKGDLAGIQAIWAPMLGITSIEGLEWCTSLVSLTLCFNSVHDLTPLQNLTSLMYLKISGNGLTNDEIKPIKNLTSLVWLKLNDNNITDITPIIENTGLNGSGDWVAINRNPLDLSSNSTVLNGIAALTGRLVNVYYTSDQFAITLFIVGNGTVQRGALNYAACDMITDSIPLIATPNEGATFIGWSGVNTSDPAAADVVIGNTITLHAFGARMITATFSSTDSSNTTQPGDEDTPGSIDIPNPGGVGVVMANEGAPGGGGSLGNKRITGFWGWINSDGILLDTIEAFSVDEFVKIVFPMNTYCLNSAGVRIPTVSIEMLEDIPEGVSASGLLMNIYSFSPEGANFKPAVPLSIRYNLADLPPGAKEENIKIVWWDKDAKKWVTLDTTVDTKKHIATAFISHFSLYSLTVETKPASFETGKLSVDKAELQKGEITQVKTTVTNTGDLPGNYQAVLAANGEKIEEKSYTIAAGATVDISFGVSFQKSGTYKIDCNGISQTLKVLPTPASFKLDGLTIAPLSSKAGDNIQVTFMVFNNGEVDGKYQLTSLLDGLAWTTQEIMVPGYSSREVKYDLKFDQAGMHDFKVNDTLTGSFKVESAATTTPAQIATVTAPAVIQETPPVTTEAVKNPKTGTILLSVAGGILIVAVLIAMVVSRVRKNRTG
jgi:hypothetical protein